MQRTAKIPAIVRAGTGHFCGRPKRRVQAALLGLSLIGSVCSTHWARPTLAASSDTSVRLNGTRSGRISLRQRGARVGGGRYLSQIIRKRDADR